MTKKTTELDEARAMAAAREFASFNCTKYVDCMNNAALSNKEMECVGCARIDFIENNYRKHIDSGIVVIKCHCNIFDEFNIGTID